MEDEQEKKPTLAIFEFQWNLTNITKKTTTILSKMIEFRGEKLFRAGLKNQGEVSHPSTLASSTLLFVTTDLAKMGLRAETVLYSDDDIMERRPVMKKMSLVIKEAADNLNGKVQLFTAPLRNFSTGTKRYKFHVYITGVVEDYQFHQKDFLLNEQLLLSATNQVGTDFEITTEKKIFPVHKFVLAARSPVFATQFDKEKEEKLYFDDSACMEQFLKFIYTGQLEGIITNPSKLKELATTYQIKTLESICKAASSKEIDEDQMVNFVLQFESLIGSSSVEIMILIQSYMTPQMKQFSITNGNGTRTRKTDGLMKSTDAFEYKKEKLARAQFKTSICGHRKLTLTLISHSRQHWGYELQQVACSMVIGPLSRDWSWMLLQEKLVPREKMLQMFFSEQEYYSERDPPSSLTLHVQVVNTIPNFDFKFVDSTWEEQIWSAAIAKKFTDVEFLIGDQSFSAHRFILSARSPVFAAMFKSGMAEDRTGQVRIDDDVDVNIFRTFLEFLYVGALKSFDDKEELFALADKYQVETLMALCKPTNEPPVDIEDFTKALLAY